MARKEQRRKVQLNTLMSKPVVKKPVSSIIELTKVSTRSTSLKEYHQELRTIGGQVFELAYKLAGTDLLKAKISLWQAISIAETKLKEGSNG